MNWKYLLLREVDLPPRDPNFLTYIPKSQFTKFNSMDVSAVNDVEEEGRGNLPNMPNIRL